MNGAIERPEEENLAEAQWLLALFTQSFLTRSTVENMNTPRGLAVGIRAATPK